MLALCSFNFTENLDLTVTPEQREPLKPLQGMPAYVAAIPFIVYVACVEDS